AAARAQHERNFVFHAEPNTLKIRGDDSIPIIVAAIHCVGDLTLDAGVVECAVEPLIGVERLLRQGRDLGGLRYVRAHEYRVTASRSDCLQSLLATSGVHI